MVDPSQISGNKTMITEPESKKEVISLKRDGTGNVPYK